LRSVGLVVDQLALLGEERKAIKPAGAGPTNVAQWRVSIPEIERRTNLDLGEAVRQADTIKEEQQPVVGEAKLMIRSFSDLLPASA
jgi:endonuclease G